MDVEMWFAAVAGVADFSNRCTYRQHLTDVHTQRTLAEMTEDDVVGAAA